MTTKDSALLGQIKTSADVYENEGFDNEEDSGTEIDFATLFLVIRRSIIWVILLILLGLTGSYLYLRWTKPVYKSSSVLKIDERSESGMLGLGKVGEAANAQQSAMNLQGEQELIKSALIFNKLKDSLALDVNYYAEGTVLESELFTGTPFIVEYKILNDAFYNARFKLVFLDSNYFRLSYQVGDEIITNDYKVNQAIKDKDFEFIIKPTSLFTKADIDRNFSFIVNSDLAIDTYLNQNLLVEIVNPNANTISISFTDHNPEKAQAIVNKINEAYLIQKKAKKELATAQTLAFLDNQLDETQTNLTQAEQDVEEFVRQNKTYDIKADVGNKLSKMEAIQKERLELQIEVALLNDFAASVARDRNNIDQIVPAFTKVQDPQLMTNLTMLGELQLRRKKMAESTHPGTTAAYKVLETEIEYVKKNIRDLVQRNKEILQRQINRIDNTLRATESDLKQLPEKETEFARLQRRYELFEKYYLLLVDKKVEFGIAKAGTTPDFQILSPASRPVAPISPDKLIVYAIGLASGIFLGIGLIASRYLMHNTVTNLREMERNLKVPILGVVPSYNKEKLLVSKIIVDKNPKSAISESMRSIRTNLEFMSGTRKKRLISITSTISGEGKTFVAVNLGGIIALSEQKVVILDLDMRKPKVNLAFDAENTKGMSTILIEKHSVQECIQKTNIPTLDFISAGPTPPNPSELILNPKFDEMLDELHQYYDVIIIDTPPVGLVTDGILVMRKADVPIFIVRANYSKKAFLKDINKLTKNNNFTHLAAILNDASSIGPYGYNSGYGYGYGYSYGYGQGYYDEDGVKGGLLSRIKAKLS